MGIPCLVVCLKHAKPSLKSMIIIFVASIYRFSHPDHPFTEREVVLAFGCSGALYNAISVLCETGDNLLVPAPGFPLALPIAENLGVHLKYYNLLPERGWEIDLEHLRL